MKGNSKIYVYGLLICIGIAAGFWYFLFRNQKFDYDKDFNTLKDVSQKISEARIKEQEKESVEREIEVLKMKLEYAREKLPTEEEIDKLLREIHDIGLQARIKFIHFVPGKKVKLSGQEYFKKPIEMKVVGPYHQIGIFLNKIGGLPRVVNVQNLSMQRVVLSNNQGVERATIKAFTYIYPDKPGDKKPPPKPKPKPH
ncbi:type 4a pilus biogenesis protein PilO [Candidatus Dependentiae bacterium]|nr:type 4a pilus biogenesis protein PilO [Candidatus Dependentiae bacterium]